MQIDIEKLNRKTPYSEPTEDFFANMQANVIAKTSALEVPVVKKQTKVIALNIKWMVAAAAVLIIGVTAFWGFGNIGDDKNINIAQQAPIVDSVYKVQDVQDDSTDLLATNNTVSPKEALVTIPNHFKGKTHTKASGSAKAISTENNMTDRQTYAVLDKKSDLEVEKVLAAFTPDQLRDIDKNSEQDVYLDLYN